MVASKSASVHKKVSTATVVKPNSADMRLASSKDPSRTTRRNQTPIALRKSPPVWLLRLYAMQRPSSIVMFSLIAIMLSVYSWTVYSQKMWSQSYRKLAILQRHERQLTATSEVLKNKMATQAEQPLTNLILPNPTQTIFLSPAPERPTPVANSVLPNSKTAKINQSHRSPLGY